MIDIDIILLALKVGILALLYVFIWRIVRAAVANVRAGASAGSALPQAASAAALGGAAGIERRPASPAAGAGARRAVSAAPRLIVEESRVLAAGADLPLAGIVTIGRGPGNDIVLDDAVVSGVHAELHPERGAYLVRDEGSTNGTFVNGERVAEALLTVGSTLRVGGTTFRFLG